MARTGSPTCPVAMLEQYIRLGGLSHSSTLSLFRGITRTKQGERLRASGSFSYTRMRELFLAKLKDLGVDSSKFAYRLMPGWLTACSSGMADGDRNQLRTDISRTLRELSCQSLRA